MNEWLRKHKTLFLTFGGLAVIGTGLYGVLSLMFRNPTASNRGPSGWYYTLGGQEKHLAPEELIQERLMRTRYRGGGSYPTPAVLQELTRYQMVRDLGFDVGRKEMEDLLRQDIMRRTNKDSVTPERYKQLLDNLQLSRSQYERLVREGATVWKYADMLDQPKVTDGALYVHYCQQKQRLRLFYKEFKSEAHEDQAGIPSPEEVNAYYEKNQAVKEAYSPDALLTKPRLSVGVVYLPATELAKKVQPTADELKKHYDDTKNLYKKDAVAGQPAPEGDAAYKPFDTVKDEVLKEYRESHLYEQAREVFDTYGLALRAATTLSAARGVPGQAAASWAGAFKEWVGDKKAPDWTAFTTVSGWKAWRTAKLTLQEFEKGTDKVGAPDFTLAGDSMLFALVQTAQSPELERLQAQMRLELLGARRIQQQTPDDGYATMRLAEGEEPRLMTKAEAAPVLQRRLREAKAAEKAQAAAKECQEKWAQGKAQPALADLKEERCTGDSRNPLARVFLSNPTTVGTVLPVAQSEMDSETRRNQPDSRRTTFLVGFVAERQVPSFEAFEKDFTYSNRDSDLKAMEDQRKRDLMNSGVEFLMTYRRPGGTNEPDPPLFEQRGAPEAPVGD